MPEGAVRKGCDPSRLQQILKGFQREISLDDGLREMVATIALTELTRSVACLRVELEEAECQRLRKGDPQFAFGKVKGSIPKKA